MSKKKTSKRLVLAGWLLLAVACQDDVPEGWRKLGLPLAGAKLHSDGAKQDDDYVQFIHAAATSHEGVCADYVATLGKHGFTVKTFGSGFNDGSATVTDLVNDQRHVEVTCSTWDEDETLVMLMSK